MPDVDLPNPLFSLHVESHGTAHTIFCHLLGVTNLLGVLTDLCDKGVSVRF